MSSKEHKTPDEQVSDEIEKEQQQAEKAEEASDNVVDPRDERIAELEAQLKELQGRDREIMLRAQAEIENIRRRAEQDIEKAHKFGLDKIINALLPVVDNLERAIELADKSNEALVPMLEGIELTRKSLIDAMKKFGVEVVEEVNVPFNPDEHEAMAMLESDQHDPNHVMLIMQKGYKLNGRLLRAAMVGVSKPKG